MTRRRSSPGSYSRAIPSRSTGVVAHTGWISHRPGCRSRSCVGAAIRRRERPARPRPCAPARRSPAWRATSPCARSLSGRSLSIAATPRSRSRGATRGAGASTREPDRPQPAASQDGTWHHRAAGAEHERDSYPLRSSQARCQRQCKRGDKLVCLTSGDPSRGRLDHTHPWIHSDVLALIARRGLGISPREVELE